MVAQRDLYRVCNSSMVGRCDLYQVNSCKVWLISGQASSVFPKYGWAALRVVRFEHTWVGVGMVV